MRKPLTQKFIESIGPSDRRVDHWDDVVRGLSLRITTSGAKSWTALYRNRDDRRVRRYTIGAFPRLSLKDARDEARRILRLAALGEDPASTKKEKRDADSFGELARIYIRAMQWNTSAVSKTISTCWIAICSRAGASAKPPPSSAAM